MKRLTMSLLSVLAGWSVALTAHAQTAVPLFSFDASGTNGAYPEANLTLGPDGNFYGTTESGGATTNGTIFKVTTNGSLTTLVNFNGTNGANPLAALTLGTDGNFYGTTEYGGNTIGNSGLDAGLGGGTVFQMTTNGTLTTLVNFAATNGANPHGGLTWDPDGNLYGTTANGGSYGDGILFQLTTGGAFTTLTNFNGANGANPFAGLTLGPDGNFYGTTQSGGSAGYGTVFEWATNGTLTTLANFDGTNNGVAPQTGLTLGPDGNLYGTTSDSYLFAYVIPGYGTINIPSGNGTIFQVTTNGTLTTLVDFDNYTAGITPNAALTVGPDGNFYGVTYLGGGNNLGTIFRVTTNGTLTTLVSFDNSNGAYSLAGLTLGPDNNLYGPATAGGAGGNGTVFKFDPCSIALAAGGGGFTVFAGSYPDSTNRIWATTNLTLPSSWQMLGTIITDTNGLGQLLDTNTADIPAKYYRLSYP
jgi:uncharacterized repeat protein (TIGR03803 family)